MQVKLIIDGKEIPLNRYVQSVFIKVVSALVSTLKGVDESWKVVRLEIKR